MCSCIFAGILSSLTKQNGLIWLCKNYQESAKSKLKEADQNFEMHSKVTQIDKKMMENSATIQGLRKTIEKEIEIKFKLLQNNFEEKLDKLIENQEKPALPKPAYHTPNFRSIMQETLEQQEKEKIEIEKLEQNIVLFRVPESKNDSPESRQKDDIEFFSDFCINSLSCNVPEVQKAIRLGEPPSPKDQIRRNRPLKIVLRDRTEKEEIFKSLKNLKTGSFLQRNRRLTRLL